MKQFCYKILDETESLFEDGHAFLDRCSKIVNGTTFTQKMKHDLKMKSCSHMVQGDAEYLSRQRRITVCEIVEHERDGLSFVLKQHIQIKMLQKYELI